MPYKCCFPFCRGNYVGWSKSSSFRFPLDKELSKKWVHAIHRKDFTTPSKYSKVCELHFTKDDIITSSTATDSKTGKTVTIELKIPRLKRDVIPPQFPNCPSYLSKK